MRAPLHWLTRVSSRTLLLPVQILTTALDVFRDVKVGQLFRFCPLIEFKSILSRFAYKVLPGDIL